MILVLFLLALIILATLLAILAMISTIEIKIKKLEIGNIEKEKNNYKIEFTLKLLDKFSIYKNTINKKKMEEIYNSKIVEKLHLKQDLKKEIKFRKKEILEILKRINIEIKKLNLKICIGLENAALTALAVGGLASIISVILPFVIKLENLKDCKYTIRPIYMQKNIYNVKLKSIIKIKMVHIIYIIYILVMKRRDENERTSNRRTYDYSNGFN